MVNTVELVVNLTYKSRNFVSNLRIFFIRLIRGTIIKYSYTFEQYLCQFDLYAGRLIREYIRLVSFYTDLVNRSLAIRGFDFRAFADQKTRESCKQQEHF